MRMRLSQNLKTTWGAIKKWRFKNGMAFMSRLLRFGSYILSEGSVFYQTQKGLKHRLGYLINVV